MAVPWSQNESVSVIYIEEATTLAQPAGVGQTLDKLQKQ